MKSTVYLKEIRGLSQPELKAKTKSIAEELMKLRFRKKSGQAEHGARISLLKRNLARAKGLLKDTELKSKVAK